MKNFYKGKTVVVTGAAGTGMGGTTAARLVEFGAKVFALDIKEVTAPVEKYVKVNLVNKEDIERAAAQLPAQIDCLFNCAALPGLPFSNLETSIVNFIGLRHMTETLIPRINSRGAIASISSTGGQFWQKRIEPIKELLKITDWEEAIAWLKANEKINNGYRFSKECVIVYTMWRASALAEREIRINCICPGPTNTPMYKAYWEKGLLETGVLKSLQGFSHRNATAEEIAWPLLFLNSDMASRITAQALYVDYGSTIGAQIGLGR